MAYVEASCLSDLQAKQRSHNLRASVCRMPYDPSIVASALDHLLRCGGCPRDKFPLDHGMRRGDLLETLLLACRSGTRIDVVRIT